ncbi:hypothetical protein ACMV8I_03235 [Ewingella sp. S1.OA.A_B6]
MAGWDYILDFPFESGCASSDTAQGPIESKVQIKSTTKNRRFSPVKLSNLLRFCKSPLPTFFLFMEFGTSKNPQDLFLVHFDNALIKESLTKIRQAEQGGGKKKLNNSSMRISYNDSHKLNSISGLDLKKMIEKYIPKGMSDYSLEKIKFTESVGFESGSGVIKFSTADEKSVIGMIEACLGYDKEVEVIDVIINEERFGIELASPLHKAPKATLKISPTDSSMSVNVKFREDKYSASIDFPAKIYIPPIPNLPEKFFRIRLKTAFLDIMIGMGERASTYQLTMGPEKHLLQDLYNQAKLLSWICIEKREILVDIQLENKPEVSATFLITPTKDGEPSGSDEWRNEVDNIERIVWIASKIKISSNLRISISEAHANREHVLKFYYLYHTRLDEIIFKFSVDGGYKELDAKKKHSTTYTFGLKLGGVLMVTIVTLQGFAKEVESNGYSLVIDKKIIEKELVCFDDETEFKEHIKNEVYLINKKYHDLDFLIVNNQSN